MPTNPPLTVAEVLELSDQDWINDGLIATVVSITKKTAIKTRRDFWVCQLADSSDGQEMVECALFTAPRFREGDRISLTGKGLKFENGQYGPKVSVGKTSVVGVLSDNTAASRPAARPAARDDSRGGEPAHEEHQDAHAGPANPTFHEKMSRTALFYLHCLSYARKINTTLKATGHPEMEPDHFQACVSTLFIAGDRAGLAVAPPPSAKIAPIPAAEPKAQAKAVAAVATPDPEEDVPF